MHKLFEDAAAVLIVLELVETGTGWRKENDITWARGVRSGLHGALYGFSTLDGYASSYLIFNFVGGHANQKGEDRFFLQRRPQQGVIAAFVFPAEDNQDSTGKGVERFQGGINIGGF